MAQIVRYLPSSRGAARVGRAFAHYGADVAVVDFNAERAAVVSAEIRQLGRRVEVVTADVKDWQQVPEMTARVRRLNECSPIGRRGGAWETIGPAVFLASDASNLVTGYSLFVDGGWTAL